MICATYLVSYFDAHRNGQTASSGLEKQCYEVHSACPPKTLTAPKEREANEHKLINYVIGLVESWGSFSCVHPTAHH